jgi:hypothetical protein
MFRHWIHLCLIAILLAAAAQRAAFAAEAESWTELRSPNFITVTNANEKQARRVACQFEMIRVVFRELFDLQRGPVLDLRSLWRRSGFDVCRTGAFPVFPPIQNHIHLGYRSWTVAIAQGSAGQV